MKKKIIIIVSIIFFIMVVLFSLFTYFFGIEQRLERKYATINTHWYNEEYEIDFVNESDYYGIGTLTANEKKYNVVICWWSPESSIIILDITNLEKMDSAEEYYTYLRNQRIFEEKKLICGPVHCRKKYCKIEVIQGIYPYKTQIILTREVINT